MDNIILVDVFDREIGSAEKAAAHRTPLLHRAFSVFIAHGGKMLIQQRALHKYHSGGLWANACCSHPREQESLESAVPRRLYEELGIAGVKAEELFSFVYLHKFHDDLYEYEYDHVFLAEYSGEISPDPEEIAETRWVDFDELAQLLLNRPDRFAPWFLIAAPRVLSHCRGQE